MLSFYVVSVVVNTGLHDHLDYSCDVKAYLLLIWLFKFMFCEEVLNLTHIN